MTRTEYKNHKRLQKILEAAAELADRLEATCGNGAEMGSLVGSMAAELAVKLDWALNAGLDGR